MKSAAPALLLVACLGALPQPASAQPPMPSGAAEPEPALEPAVPDDEQVVGPTPGAPTTTLSAAVRLALERNFGALDARDTVTRARWQEKVAFAQFLPSVTPFYQRIEGRSAYQLDVAQALPWLGGSLSATGRYLTDPAQDAPFPRTTDLRVLFTQPLLRGFGPNASLFDLRNARRARAGQERALTLTEQRLAIDVARAFYDVIAFRQLLDVARQSLARTEALLRSSNARLEVGMASKLDVFRAEVQASQARDAMVRAETSLATALERFRGFLALPPGDPVEPEAAALPTPAASGTEDVAALVSRALAFRLELREARDQLGDARRSASLARQNRLPQVDVNVGLTQLGVGGSFGDAWTAGDRRVEVFLSASYPLKQRDLRAQQAFAEIEVGGSERRIREGELAVEQQVRQAVRELEQIRKSVELQKAAVRVASQQRRLAVLRYERGLGSNFDVVDAESSLVTARSALVRLVADWAVARLELERVTGTLDVLTEFAP